MTTISIGRTMSAFALATAASMIAIAPASAARSSVAPQATGPHLIATIPLDGAPLDVATDPVTDMVYVSEPFKLVVIDGKTNTVVASVHVPDPAFGVAANGPVRPGLPGFGVELSTCGFRGASYQCAAALTPAGRP